MRITLLAVGKRMPSWVEAGFADYQKRITGEWRLELIEIPTAKRTQRDTIAELMEKEGQALLKAVPRQHRIIALDSGGRQFSSTQFAKHLNEYHAVGQAIALLIGGPDGLAPTVLDSADEKWSLSALTLPHPLVRLVLAEAIYRAHSILTGHPYHR
jgi:23S rRNA (pseudouridine1915-N3)-methyltransferase